MHACSCIPAHACAPVKCPFISPTSRNPPAPLPGHVATLAVWEAEVVGSFFMTPEAVAHACHVGYSHDTSLPQPQQSEGDD